MKTIIYLIAAAAAYLIIAPANYTYPVTKHFYRLINNPAQLCFDLNSKALVDQKSAYITGDNTFSNYVHVTFKAKNGLNMMLSGSFECPLTNGKFDEHQAFIYMLDKRLGKNPPLTPEQ